MEIQKMELFDGIHQIEPFDGFHRKSKKWDHFMESIKWYHFFGKLYVILIFSAFEKIWHTWFICFHFMANYMDTITGYNTGGGRAGPGGDCKASGEAPSS